MRWKKSPIQTPQGWNVFLTIMKFRQWPIDILQGVHLSHFHRNRPGVPNAQPLAPWLAKHCVVTSNAVGLCFMLHRVVDKELYVLIRENERDYVFWENSNRQTYYMYMRNIEEIPASGIMLSEILHKKDCAWLIPMGDIYRAITSKLSECGHRKKLLPSVVVVVVVFISSNCTMA